METQITRQPCAVVAFDFSETAEHALQAGLALAANSPDLILHVVTVASSPRFPETFADEKRVEHFLKSEEILAAKMHHHVTERRDLFEQATGKRVERITCHPRFGDPAEQIVELAAAVDADLILVGTQGRRGLQRALLGSVAAKVAREAGCAVQMARPKAHPKVETPVEEVEPPPLRGQGSRLGPRHTYHYVARRMGNDMPVVY